VRVRWREGEETKAKPAGVIVVVVVEEEAAEEEEG
jgi:hypothetical protein